MKTASDLLLKTPKDAAKKCRIREDKMEVLMDIVCKALYSAVEPRPLNDVVHGEEECFTTGDIAIDEAFRGGIRVRTVWEICGTRSELTIWQYPTTS